MEKKKRPRIKRSPDVKPGRRNGAQGFSMETGRYIDRDNGNKNAPTYQDKYRSKLEDQIAKHPLKGSI